MSNFMNLVGASIGAIEYYFPENILTNEALSTEFPEWTPERIGKKLDIASRHICSQDECASDLAYHAAKKLFASGACAPEDVDFILLCTQSPDYFLPTTACMLQDRLGIPMTAGALDFNLGCSGYIYGLSLAKGLIETNQAKNILFITAETYSKYVHERDKTTRALFGDAAAATLVQGKVGVSSIDHFVFGTDGRGAKNLIVENGAMRNRSVGGAETGGSFLRMNGPEMFVFILSVVPRIVSDVLVKANKTKEEIDLFIFHQANSYVLETLRDKIKIPKEKFYISMKDCGNTVSSTIPIAMKCALSDGVLKKGMQVMLVGFGVGYSYGGVLIRL